MKYEKVSQFWPVLIQYKCELILAQLNLGGHMISKLLMIGGISLLSVSYYYIRKENYFAKLFQEIEKSNKFHLDYVDDLSKLPLNKDIILFGQPKSDNTQKVLLTSFLKKSKKNSKQQERKSQFQTPKDDRFWSLQFSGEFYMKTLSNQKIIIKKDQTQILYAFNLPKRNQNQEFQQRVVVKNQPVCVYGKLQNKGSQVLLKTKMILGTKNQSFLTFLDGEIIKLNKKNKMFGVAGVSVLAIHALYINFTKRPQKLIENVDISKISQTQTLLKQIQQFKDANGKK